MLQTLSLLDYETASIGGGIFDNPSGEARIPNFKEQLENAKGKEILVNVDSSVNPANPIRHYFFTGFKSTDWNAITSYESLAVFSSTTRSFSNRLNPTW